MQDRPRVGEILVAAGIIDQMQLDAALGEQARWGRRLGVTLIKMGLVEEGHLIRALAKQLDLPVASLAGKKIPPEVIALVPARVASEHGVIPLFTKLDGPSVQLYLGMEDPSNLEVLDDLCFRTGMEIHPVMVGPSELGEAIDRYYHGRRQAGPPKSDPFHPGDGRRGDTLPADALLGDTMGQSSLRVVTDASPQPGTAAITPAPPPARELETPADESAIELSEPVDRWPEELIDDVARALEETERTRLVAKALTQLLIEKGVLSLDEVQSRVAKLKSAARRSPELD